MDTTHKKPSTRPNRLQDPISLEISEMFEECTGYYDRAEQRIQNEINAVMSTPHENRALVIKPLLNSNYPVN